MFRRFIESFSGNFWFGSSKEKTKEEPITPPKGAPIKDRGTVVIPRIIEESDKEQIKKAWAQIETLSRSTDHKQMPKSNPQTLLEQYKTPEKLREELAVSLAAYDEENTESSQEDAHFPFLREYPKNLSQDFYTKSNAGIEDFRRIQAAQKPPTQIVNPEYVIGHLDTENIPGKKLIGNNTIPDDRNETLNTPPDDLPTRDHIFDANDLK